MPDYSFSAVPAADILLLNAGKPILGGGNVLTAASLCQWTGGGFGDSYLRDGKLFNSKPLSSSTSHTIDITWDSGSGEFDAATIFGENLAGTSITISIYNVDTAAWVQIGDLSDATADRVRFGSFNLTHLIDPQVYSGVLQMKIDITNGTSFKPKVGEIWIGKRYQLQWEQHRPGNKENYSQNVGVIVSESGVRTHVLKYDGALHLEGVWSVNSAAKEAEIISWFRSISHGSDPWPYWADPSLGVQNWRLMFSEPGDLAFQNVGPSLRELELEAMEQGPHFLGSESLETEAPLFELSELSSGPTLLPRRLEMGGSSYEPTFRYLATDATLTGWEEDEYGETLDYVTVLTAPDIDKETAFLDGSKAVGFNSSDYFRALTAGLGDPALNDFIVEIVWIQPEVPGAHEALVHNYTAATDGWWVMIDTSGRLAFTVDDGPTSVVGQSLAIEPGALNHALIFFDKSDTARCYINGKQDGSTPSLAALGSVTSTAKLSIGAADGGGNGLSSDIISCSMYEGSGIISATTADVDAVASKRFHEIAGTLANINTDSTTPATSTRASQAVLERNLALYPVGENWPRVEPAGLLMEGSSENLLLQSEDISTTWVKADAGDTFDLNAIESPISGVLADGMIADSSNGPHGMEQTTAALTAANYTLSVFARPGDQSFLMFSNATIGSCDSWFDLTSGTVGTTEGNVISSTIKKYSNGFYRCSITFLGTAAAHSVYVRSADADNSPAFSGDSATVNTYIVGMQLEQGDVPSSYIANTTTATTRPGDVLEFDTTPNGVDNKGRLVVEYASVVDATAHAVSVAAISDGTTGNRIEILSGAGDTVLKYEVEDGSSVQASLSTAPSFGDGVKRKSEIRWRTNNTQGLVDGAADPASADVACTIPTMDTVSIGCGPGGTGSAFGHVSSVKIYGKDLPS